MYIGLISDTHGVFDDRFKEFLEPVDQIWHAGDFGGGMDLAEEIFACPSSFGGYGKIWKISDILASVFVVCGPIRFCRANLEN